MASRSVRRLGLSEGHVGDPALIERVQRAVAPRQHDHLSVAVLASGGWEWAHFGAADAQSYEIGSITKTFTAALFAIAIDRGELSAETTAGAVLELGDSAAAALRLGDIATHHSGLPRLPLNFADLRRGARAVRARRDPYEASVDELVSLAARSPMAKPGAFLYSNLGYAVLGQAVAAAAEQSYAQLLAERITRPLALADTQSFPKVEDLPAGAPRGRDRRGRTSDPWTMNAYGPAGNIRSTLQDMMRYVQAQLENSAPGVSATAPQVAVRGQGEIGYAWITRQDGLTWHNGMTGGFASFVGFDRSRSRAVVVLSNTAVSVDRLALSLVAPR
ncbi:serine hydrolase [Salinibacterium sp. M195]|uniref:serine hydrolase domain-containing protein n=1 Tax=Salinibacterium sp. M195 TaxID=2583374 RepID=UPI001C62F245|nr:serine hydrolase domain-containing protein [Salinibacterium sp. M195]